MRDHPSVGGERCGVAGALQPVVRTVEPELASLVGADAGYGLDPPAHPAYEPVDEAEIEGMYPAVRDGVADRHTLPASGIGQDLAGGLMGVGLWCGGQQMVCGHGNRGRSCCGRRTNKNGPPWRLPPLLCGGHRHIAHLLGEASA
ncbi:Uncharacterised protein [Mycobacteroides abscessus subsp. massiliense]|nr:Uncharacterised protein [Mycobacteroides abscessus subsp. massiliense]